MRAIRITQANWLNDQVGGDQGTVKLVEDGMAREAVEVHRIAEYAPEWDTPGTVSFVGPDAAAERMKQLGVTVTDFEGEREAAERRAQAMQQLAEETEKLGLYDTPAVTDVKLPDSPPAPNDIKMKWIDWAVSQGCSMEDAVGMSKNELMGRYGERL